MLPRLFASLGLTLCLAASKEAPVEVPRLELNTQSVAPTLTAAPQLDVSALPPALPVSPALATSASALRAQALPERAQGGSLPPAAAQAERTAEGEPKSIEAASVEAATRFDKSKTPAAGAENGSAEALVAAYQDGALAQSGATEATQKLLERAADHAVRAKLAEGRFKIYYLYGAIMGTRMYEAPELPGVLLKTYAAPLGWKGKAWKGYNLAKARLGGLFAETTIVENVEVVIDGKKRTLPWALVQEKVRVENVKDFGKRSTEVLLGMLKRGVRDNDQRQRGIEQLDIHRNLGETADGRVVHFDADFFAQEKDAAEGPKRVRDPPVLREAIRVEQLAALKPQDLPQWSFLDRGTLTAPEKEALIDFSGKVIAAAPAGSRAAIDKQIRRVLSIGQRAGYDDRPGVRALVGQIARGGKLKYNGDFFVEGSVELEDGALDIEVSVINFEKVSSFLNKDGIATGRKQTQGRASQAYAQTLYALVKGAALRAESDAAIKRVTLGGWKVMNQELAVELLGLGFARVPDPRVAGTAFEDRFPASWVLRVPVRP